MPVGYPIPSEMEDWSPVGPVIEPVEALEPFVVEEYVVARTLPISDPQHPDNLPPPPKPKRVRKAPAKKAAAKKAAAKKAAK